MGLHDPNDQSTASEIADYLAQGLGYAAFLDDQTYKCTCCGRRYDSWYDGRDDDRSDWFCGPCLDSGESGAFFEGDDRWKEREDR
jgi:hypothetical protein